MTSSFNPPTSCQLAQPSGGLRASFTASSMASPWLWVSMATGSSAALDSRWDIVRRQCGQQDDLEPDITNAVSWPTAGILLTSISSFPSIVNLSDFAFSSHPNGAGIADERTVAICSDIALRKSCKLLEVD